MGSGQPWGVALAVPQGDRRPCGRRLSPVPNGIDKRDDLSALHVATTRRMTVAAGSVFARELISHLPALRRYATALTGNSTLADDLVQDGIERALTRAATLQQPERLGAWLRSIVHNLYLDELRRRRVRGVNVDMADLADDAALSTPAANHGVFNDVARAMATLSVEHRQILVLAGVEELTYREIADELAMPIGTVMSRLARARTALRASLEGSAVGHPASREPSP